MTLYRTIHNQFEEREMDNSASGILGLFNRVTDAGHRSIKRLFHRVSRAILSSQFFHLRTQWAIRGDIHEMADLLLDSSNLQHWWSDCFLATETLKPGDHHANGRVFNVITRGVLPYNLHFQVEILRVNYPYQFVLRSNGNFIGRAIGRLRQQGDEVVVDFDWKIRFAKPVLNCLCWILHPLYVANHRWIMHRGQVHAAAAIQSRRSGAFPTTSTTRRPAVRSRGLADALAFGGFAKQLFWPSQDASAVWAARQEVASR